MGSQKMKNRGKLYVISGPSGVGKGTVCRIITDKNDNLSVSVSATTRSPRTEDTDGVTYFFKSKDAFEEMIKNGEFLEWAKYNENYYGTPIAPVVEKLENGKDVILEIDVQGALEVRKKLDDAVLIFIAPPDENTLYERLKNRATETEAEIKKRIAAAKHEIELKEKYDYVVINDRLEDAVGQIEDIMKKEKMAK